jgi:hypothetical protein
MEVLIKPLLIHNAKTTPHLLFYKCSELQYDAVCEQYHTIGIAGCTSVLRKIPHSLISPAPKQRKGIQAKCIIDMSW